MDERYQAPVSASELAILDSRECPSGSSCQGSKQSPRRDRTSTGPSLERHSMASVNKIFTKPKDSDNLLLTGGITTIEKKLERPCKVGSTVYQTSQSQEIQTPCSHSGCKGQAAFLVQPIPYCCQHLPAKHQHIPAKHQHIPAKHHMSLYDELIQNDVLGSQGDADFMFPPSMPSTKPPGRPTLYDTVADPIETCTSSCCRPGTRSSNMMRRSQQERLPMAASGQIYTGNMDRQLSNSHQKHCRSRDCEFFGCPEYGGYCSEHLRQYTIADARGLISQKQHGHQHSPSLDRLESGNIYETIGGIRTLSMNANAHYANNHLDNPSQNYVECYPADCMAIASNTHQKTFGMMAKEDPYRKPVVSFSSNQGYEVATHNHVCGKEQVVNPPRYMADRRHDWTPERSVLDQEFSHKYEDVVTQMVSNSKRCMLPGCENFGNPNNRGYCNSCSKIKLSHPFC